MAEKALENVRHRIDGLEISQPRQAQTLAVRHRIDGLEMPTRHAR